VNLDLRKREASPLSGSPLDALSVSVRTIEPSQLRELAAAPQPNLQLPRAPSAQPEAFPERLGPERAEDVAARLEARPTGREQGCRPSSATPSRTSEIAYRILTHAGAHLARVATPGILDRADLQAIEILHRAKRQVQLDALSELVDPTTGGQERAE
jgi:hypothetical protein